MSHSDLWTRTGIAGMVGILCYILAIAVRWPDTQLGYSLSLIVVSLFPILCTIFGYGLSHYIGNETDGAANRLAFPFAIAGFSTLLAMIFIQLAIGAGISEMTKGVDPQTAKAIRRGLRLVDHGLDVAWDFLISVALVAWGYAMRRRSGLGLRWGLPCALAGLACIGLNAATFPWPPADRGLFDVGPYCATFMFLLAGRLAWLGLRRRPAAVTLPVSRTAAVDAGVGGA